jgi:cell division protein FtsN
MVGPFGSRDEAVQVCTNLKAAGGQCVIQGN